MHRRSPRARGRLRAALLAVCLTFAAAIVAPPAAMAVLSFSNVGTPVIAGSAAIGDTLTASLDTSATTPTPTTVTYTWYRVDTGAPVGTGEELVVTRALEGTGVYVIARLQADGYGDYVTLNSPFSATVHEGGFTNVIDPTVSGSGVIGTDFTASIDTSGVTPAPDAVAYEWFRVDTGASVGTGSTLTATSALLGTPLYVIATLSAADRQDYVTANSPFSATVRLRAFDGVGAPTITGTGAVGTDFTVSLDTTGITPAPEAIVYDWYRVDTGAHLGTGTRITATSALRGTAVYAVATLSATDTHDYVTTNSAFSRGIHLASFTPGDAPVLRGHHALGSTLTASLSAAGWSPTPTAVAWQWHLSDGTAIAGADEATLELTRDLVGESVYAVATVSAPQTQPYEIATAPSGLIAAPTLSVGGSGRSVAAGDELTVTIWGLLFDTAYDLELHSTPVALGTFTSAGDGTLKATVRIPADTPAGDHHIVVLLDGVEVASVAVTIGGGADELAATGSEGTPGVTALFGAGLLLAGLVLLTARAARRRGKGAHLALR